MFCGCKCAVSSHRRSWLPLSDSVIGCSSHKGNSNGRAHKNNENKNRRKYKHTGKQVLLTQDTGATHTQETGTTHTQETGTTHTQETGITHTQEIDSTQTQKTGTTHIQETDTTHTQEKVLLTQETGTTHILTIATETITCNYYKKVLTHLKRYNSIKSL